MKFKMLVLTLLILTNCGNSNQIILQERPNKSVILDSHPRWLYQLPDTENYVIGLSQLSTNEEECQESAKQMASVMKSRNSSSFVIDKFAQKTNTDIMKSGEAKYKLNVSSVPEKAEKYYENLELKDEYKFSGFYIGLYSLIQQDVPAKCKDKIIMQIPEHEQNIIETDQGIIVRAESSSADLVAAWEKAGENARTEIAKYISSKVVGSLLSDDEIIKKNIALETTVETGSMQIMESYIQSEIYDGLPSYRVFHTFKAEIK
jgi:hypothetical protein